LKLQTRGSPQINNVTDVAKKDSVWEGQGATGGRRKSLERRKETNRREPRRSRTEKRE